MFRATLISAYRRIPLLASIILILTACESQINEKQNSPEAGKYIAAFTTGVISSDDEIIIRFVDQHPDARDFYHPIDEQLFVFQPSVKGQAYWIDDYTLGFKPDEKLKQATRFQAVLKLAKLFEVDASLNEFYFSFQTRVLDFTIDVGALTPYPGQSDYYKLKGSLDFSDSPVDEEARQIVKATQEGRELPVQWRMVKNGLMVEFEIDSIIRKDMEGEVHLIWDGSPAGIRNCPGHPAQTDRKRC